MQKTHTYTRELEYLIQSVLLPVYDAYYRERGELPPYTSFPKGILKEVMKPRPLPKLFQPKDE
jgi:hypothetical protein